MGSIQIDKHLFMKGTIKEKWQRCTTDDILANLILKIQVLPPEIKAIIPAFGFDKKEKSRINEQLFPTHFIILELDTPPRWKEKIKAGCLQTLKMAQAQTEQVYFQLYYASIPYYWMYLTPSTCGLRFVLQTDIPVLNELHYKQVVLDYLRLLYRITYGKLNTDYHDIRVHQAWFVPTFYDRFASNEETIKIRPFKPDIESKEVASQRIQHNTYIENPEGLFLKAIQFTERNFTYREGSRNKYLHNLACNCNRFGIAQSATVQWINTQFDLEEQEITATINSAYRNNSIEFAKFTH